MVSVRVSCQTMACRTGVPELRSQTTTVSRWLAIPTAAMSAAVAPTSRSTRGTMRPTLRQISAASCSTQPGFGKYWRCSSCATDTSCPPWSNRIDRVEVVP